MILVDTSVWVRHLRTGDAHLRALLLDEQVLGHPYVLGELACGTLRNRSELLHLLGALPQAPTADQDEVLHMIESRRLYGRGLGWVDSHLLASALLAESTLWTLDGALRRAATLVGVAARAGK